MHDEQIVALYWDRKEDAIRQTQQKCRNGSMFTKRL